MRFPLLVVLAGFAGLGSALKAEVPRVTVDIAPLHALVSQVMAGVGEPDLIVDPKASPHEMSLRPSQARALERADVVFWTSAGLTPWLLHPLDVLAAEARLVEIMRHERTVTLPFREDGAEHEADHDHDHGHGDDHAEEGLDPHGWLDPANARAWVEIIAAELTDLDPEHGPQFEANARAAQEELDALVAELETTLTAVRSEAYVTFHDAFQYFDARFGLAYAGALSLGDATAPSPARLSALKAQLEQTGVRCIFTEPQQNPRLAAVLAEGTEVRLGVLDAMGAGHEPGPDLYSDVLRGLATSMVDCLAD